MGIVVGTKNVLTEFSGKYKILHLTATVTSESDEITLTEAVHGIGTIDGIVSCFTKTGLDAAFTYLQCSYSGLVITVASFENDGTVATDFTTTTVCVVLIGH